MEEWEWEEKQKEQLVGEEYGWVIKICCGITIIEIPIERGRE